MGFSILDTWFIALLAKKRTGPTFLPSTTSEETGVDGFYATLCTAGTTLFLADPNGDWGTTFDNGDIVILERESDNTFWCATVGTFTSGEAEEWHYEGSFSHADCAECVNSGYGG